MLKEIEPPVPTDTRLTHPDPCPHCGGKIKFGATQFPEDNLVCIIFLTAWVCQNCGRIYEDAEQLDAQRAARETEKSGKMHEDEGSTN